MGMNFLTSVKFQHRGHAEWWRVQHFVDPANEEEVHMDDYLVTPVTWPLREFVDPRDVLEFVLRTEQPGPREYDLILTFEYDIPGEPAWVWRSHTYLLLAPETYRRFNCQRPDARLERQDLPFVMHCLEYSFPSSRRNPPTANDES